LLKYSHLQPSEMDRMPFFELEELLDSLKMLNEKEEEERKKNEKQQGAATSTPNFNTSAMQKQMSQGKMPSMPSMPNFNL